MSRNQIFIKVPICRECERMTMGGEDYEPCCYYDELNFVDPDKPCIFMDRVPWIWKDKKESDD